MSVPLEKVALVTGASRGIGRAVAIGLAKDGAKVIINYASNEEEAVKTADFISKTGGSPSPLLLKFDVSKEEEVEEAIENIRTQLGGVDILVNNAGISKDGLLIRFKSDNWRRVLATNLDGAFYCSRACSKHMIKRRWGRIVNISSVVGEKGNAGQVAYVTAKAGLIGMTKSMALELASRNITVNAISPGYIKTDMTSVFSEQFQNDLLRQIPMQMPGEAEDVAQAVLYLVSPKARYVTGHVLKVNGGMYM